MFGKRFGGLVFAVILLSLIVVPMASAESVGASWLNALGLKNIDSSASFNQFLGQDNVLVAQFLIFVLVALIIYSIAPFLPFVADNPWIAGVISIVVALLATLFLSAQDIRAVVLSYGALGLVLTAVIPFFAMVAVTKRSYENQQFVFAWAMWLAFIIITSYRFITADVNEVGAMGKLILPAIILLSIIMFFFQGKIYLFLFKRGVREGSNVMKEEALADVTSQLDELSAKIANASDPVIVRTLTIKYNKKAKLQRSLGGSYNDRVVP